MTYDPNNQGTVSIANNEGFLDVKNSYLQAIVTVPAQYALNTDAGASFVPDQMASSIIQRVLVKSGG